MTKPDFLGIGAQKSGTTWLWQQLRLHPQLFFPETKEIHFWDLHYSRGYKWYENQFHPDVDGLAGEITAAYAILPIETIAEIHSRYPELRLLYLLRNPIDRAWSAALMALQRAEMVISEASDQWFIDHFHSSGSRLRGDYATCLDHWLTYYPREQLYAGHYDRISSDPQGLLSEVCTHLGIDQFSTIGITLNFSSRFNKSIDAPLRESLYPVLQELYQPVIARLERDYGITF